MDKYDIIRTEKEMVKLAKKETIQKVVAAGVTLSLAIGAYFVITYEKPMVMDEVIPFSTGQLVNSTDIKATAANFISVNGTMGDMEDITKDTLWDLSLLRNNTTNRLEAYRAAKRAMEPNSPLIRENTERHIQRHTQDLDFPYVYRVENVKVGNIIEEKRIKIESPNGLIDYDSVRVPISFDSIVTRVTCPMDTSYEGIHTIIENRDSIETEMVLVKSGDIWVVYDIINAEALANSRFATWSGIRNYTSNFENDVEVGQIIVDIEDDVEPIVEMESIERGDIEITDDEPENNNTGGEEGE